MGVDLMIGRLFTALEALLEPTASALKHSAIAYLVAVVVGSLTVIQFTIDFWARKEERNERRATAVERAWQSLLTPLGGDTGKGASLNFLFESKAFSANVTLTCQNMGIWDDIQDRCVEQPYLSGVVFPPITGDLPGDVYVNNQLLQMARLIYPYINDVQIVDSDMRRALVGFEFGELTYFRRVGFESAVIASPPMNVPGRGDYPFNGPTIEQSDLSNAFVAEDAVHWIRESNLTGVTVYPSRRTFYENGHQWHHRARPITDTGNWAWADNPPKVLMTAHAGLLWLDVDWLTNSSITLCDPRQRMREDSTPAYRDLNGRYTPHFELVRQFEFVPLGDGTLQPKPEDKIAYFRPALIYTSERFPFCHRMTPQEAAEVWPQVYNDTGAGDRMLDLAKRFMGRTNLAIEMERNKNWLHDEPP